MAELDQYQQGEVVNYKDITLQNRFEIIEEGLRKKYLSRLTEMQIVPIQDLPDLEEDLIDNVRMYKVSEMVYQKGESVTDKFTTVFNTLSTYNSSVFIIIDSDGLNTSVYVGVRNNETDLSLKRSTVTLGDTLKYTLIGHFPGIKIQNENRSNIARLSEKINRQHNVASVSVVGSSKTNKEQTNEQFVQGIEKLALAMQGRQYIGIIVAENQSPQRIQEFRRNFQDLYTKISPYQKIQFTENASNTTSRSKSFVEMSGAQKAAMVGNAVLSVGGSVGGLLGAGVLGAMIGSQVSGQLNGFISALAPQEQISNTSGTSTSTTTENKTVTDLLQLLDDSLKRVNEFDSYGMWNVAGYFISDDMSAAEIAASNYRSLMNGDTSGRELSSINSWRSNNPYLVGNFDDLTTYLSRFLHPRFYYGTNSILTDATTSISGKELGLHMGLPRATISGLPVIEHAEFGKEVTSYQLFRKTRNLNPEDTLH